MTFIDFISKQIQLKSTDRSSHSSSTRPKKSTKKNRSIKAEILPEEHPSIIKTSELSRCVSKKTVTFASVFDAEGTDDLLVEKRTPLDLVSDVVSSSV